MTIKKIDIFNYT